MSPFFQKLIGAIVRTAVVWLAGKFGAGLSEDESLKLAAEITPFIAVLAWSIYQKYREQQKLLTALTMRAGASEADVEVEVQRGNAPPVNTPRGVAPI